MLGEGLVSGYGFRVVEDDAHEDGGAYPGDDGQCRVAHEELGATEDNHASNDNQGDDDVDCFVVLGGEALEVLHDVFLTRCSACFSL